MIQRILQESSDWTPDQQVVEFAHCHCDACGGPDPSCELCDSDNEEEAP